METHAYHLSVWEAEAEASGIQGYPWLYAKFQTILSYMRPYYQFFFFNLEKRKKEKRAEDGAQSGTQAYGVLVLGFNE